ncbi:class I SAM-dependent methyltransferase [Paenibacillus lutrae]|uniref:Class I SAM-dependent methyltransferase n=1 Tax=Paenibacillus lutrae TaxID=2078573 RepID=A0A7X3FKK1_9BACL|nr:class I SAM-dependent methyltransferase [Paenibacillus lutrae]MVP01456.1 hypothetical protein [Paenibacillus lutrae]
MSKWKISEPVFEADYKNEKLRIAPWEGHRIFAYDFLQFFRPNKILELGTHYGCSFFAFCQSVKDFKLDTELYAIDTWRGDEQAGLYGEEVFNTVKDTVNDSFSDIRVNLIRRTFDEALDLFEDNSIDMIHIDGLHTYEAVSHDFLTWLPKLKENGVILFHDVFSPAGYGSNRYWKELKEQFSYLEFRHSWGLGLLFPKGDHLLKKMMEINIEDKISLYQYKALYEFEQIKTKDLSNMVLQRDIAIKSNEEMIIERDQSLKDARNLIKSKTDAFEAAEIMIKERDMALVNSEYMIKERDEALSKAENMIKDRDEALASAESMIIERDELIKNMENMIGIKDNELRNIQEEVKDLKEQFNELTLKCEENERIIESYKSKKIIVNLKRPYK